MTKVRRATLLIALRQISAVAVLGVLPVIAVFLTLRLASGGHDFFFDFNGTLYQAASAIVHGRDPYDPSFLAGLAQIKHAGGTPTATFAVPVYPAPALVAAVPLTALPARAAGLVFALVSIAAMIAGLRLLGVRDWRCYGAAFLSWPLLHTLRLGQVNAFLVLGAAVAWHWRARLWTPAVAVALTVVAKLLLWPLGVWLIVTRRWRVLACAVLVAVAVTVAGWAVIGFDGLSAYPRMLHDLSQVDGPRGVSLNSIGQAVGVSGRISEVIAWVLTAGLLAVSLRAARGPHTDPHDAQDGERRALGLAVMAALTASTLVWPHYLTLVFVPIALLSPEFSVLWLVPLIAYLAPVELTDGDIWRMLPYVAIEVLVIGSLCLGGPGRPQLPRFRPLPEVASGSR
jgi:alpha-1,2-mannosyltransferase